MTETKIWHSKKMIIALMIVVAFLPLYSLYVYSQDVTYFPSGKIYESDGKSNHDISSGSSVTNFSYGKTSVGHFMIVGDISRQTTYNGKTSYGVNDVITFGYTYNKEYQDGAKEDWNLCPDDGKDVAGISLAKKIQNGVIIVQKSLDGSAWENACEPLYDFFDKNKNGKKDIYVTTEDEIRVGTYYRFIVAYEMKRKTGGSWPNVQWSERDFTEVYEFFICSDRNDIVLRSITERNPLQDNATVDKGFYVDHAGSSASVTIARNNGAPMNAGYGSYRTDKGSYVVNITTKLGQTYKRTVEVSNGTALTTVNPLVYESDDGAGYNENKRVPGANCYGALSMTNLKIGTRYGYDTTQSVYNGKTAYGVAGDSVSLFLSLDYPLTLNGNGGWEVVYDKWGKKDKETVDGVQVNEVGRGALIIQKSVDGKNWYDLEAGRYANGLYTTDFGNYYKSKENILIYTPDGTDVLNGIYIRVLYAYEVYQSSTKTYKDYLEKYDFYLCSSELDAVAFHNLSASGQVQDMFGDENEEIVDVYRQAETMLSGAATTSGFEVDTGLNKTVTYDIKRNGTDLEKNSNNQYTTTGRYDVTLHSRVGTDKQVTIYVDRNSSEKALEVYFGDCFINGKRIFSEGEYPVYEAGNTSYNVMQLSNEYLPVGGRITNLDTKKTIDIDSTRTAKNGVLSEAGEYEAVFTTMVMDENKEYSGDYRTFTFRFRLIEEGTAPGPEINQQSMDIYSHSHMSDSYPIYYGLTYQSASKGTITLAFKDYDTAREYAYEYEKKLVEEQADGTFRYIGSSFVAQKESYNDQWDLTDEINNYADMAVQRLCFDMSDSFTYTTLRESVLEANVNPRRLELDRSVVIFGEGQRELLTNINCLPILNNKKYNFIMPGVNGTIQSGHEGFQFVHDKYGCDSENVTIIDNSGKEYTIAYNRDVAPQLEAAGCPTGIVTIKETTVYGDEATYQAVYFQPGDNSASLQISYYSKGIENTVDVNINNADEIKIQADAFYISDFVDELDPYCLVIVDTPDNTREFYAADQLVKDAWIDAGEYKVSVVNRLGNKYSFTVDVNESDYSKVTFDGSGTDTIRNIVTQYGEKNIALPELTREGYTFAGYVDEMGNSYREKIEEIHFKGDLILEAKWIPDKCEVVLQNDLHEEIERHTVDYDSIYRLPVPEVNEGYEFVSWTRDGIDVENEIRVDEQEVILVAKTRDINTGLIVGEEPENVDNTVDDGQNNTKGKSSPFPVVILGVFVVVIAIVIKNGKKMNDKEGTSKNSKEESPSIAEGKKNELEDETVDTTKSASDIENEKHNDGENGSTEMDKETKDEENS